MYDTLLTRRDTARSFACFTILLAGIVAVSLSHASSSAAAQNYAQPQSVILKISGLSEKLELTTNSSRILTLDKKIPRVQVNNPELLSVTPLSATQIQISAKKAGVTQINLWDEEGQVHSVDILIYGDVRELEHALAIQFPHSSIRVYRYSESLVLKGFVDRPDHVSQITRLAEDYAPKVINNISVGGVQQILLHVKVMEVSRTKLRRLGVDFAQLASNGSFAASSVNGLLATVSNSVAGVQTVTDTAGQTFEFGIVDGNDAFFGFLNALQQNNVAKILAEPNIVAVSGRPAQFNVGGEIPIIVPQSLGTSSIEFKKYGTQVDFLPIVLGNGNIRLEVRPRVSEIDDSRSVVVQSYTVPALTVREVDTAVEMKAGQTFALAGLIQERVEAQSRGLPYLADIPIIGVPFRGVEEEVNEIELLILVTPEFIDAMDPHEVPCGGPGMDTVSPSNCDLYWGAHLEVPAHVNPIRGPQACGNGCDCMYGTSDASVTGEMMLPGEMQYDDVVPSDAASMQHPVESQELPPIGSQDIGPIKPVTMAPLPPATSVQQRDEGAQSQKESGLWHFNPFRSARKASQGEVKKEQTVPRPYSPQREPNYVRNASDQNETQSPTPASGSDELSGLIGPVGYDVR